MPSSRTPRNGLPGLSCTVLIVALALGGCQSSGGGALSALTSAVSGPKTEAPGVPIAVESIEGAPDPVKTRLASALMSEASARKVELVGRDGPARYRVRGYLTAYQTADGGTALGFVWDVFDQANKRSRRVEGANVAAKASTADPWSAATPAALDKVASASMDEIARFLATNGKVEAADSEQAPASSTAFGLAAN